MAPRARIKAPRARAKCSECPLNGRPCVPGYGCTSHPDIMFIAEAPGETEVDVGQPLIGKSGSFLRRVIKDLGIAESRCYFTNTVLCHPPGNKKPQAGIIHACFQRLLREIKVVQPRFIVCLGGVPTQALLRTGRGIVKSHGVYTVIKLKSGLKIPAMPTYHPAGVLRGTEFFPDFVDELDLVKRILEGEEPVIEPPYENYEVIDTQERFDTFMTELSEQSLMGCDIEADKLQWGDGKILCVGFSWERGTAHIIDWDALITDNLPNIQALNRALKTVKLGFHNGLYDVPFMLHDGLSNTSYYYDTMLAHYLLDERHATHSLERLAVKYYKAPTYKWAFRKRLGIKDKVTDEMFAWALKRIPKRELFMYNGADVDYTYRLMRDLTKQLRAENLLPVLRDIEMPAARMFMEFTMGGMLVDQGYWRAMVRGWKRGIDELDKQIREYPYMGDINIGSTKKLADVLYDKMGLLPFGGAASFAKKKCDADDIALAIHEVKDQEAREYWTSQRTKMSQGMQGMAGDIKGLAPRSTTTYMLYYLKQQHPLPGLIIRWRHLKKRYDMYYKGFKKYMWRDGRVHPQYRLTGTRTGRKSSEKPAMHNLPQGDEVYNVFIADPGWVDLHADYQSAEMRMMAHYSGDKHLLHILDTSDLHTRFAQEIFGLTDEQIAAMPKDELKAKRIASKMICLTPSQRVLTARLEWKPVGELEVGEQIISFTEEAPGFQEKRRRWLVTRVTSNKRRLAYCYEVHLRDGSIITTTGHHRWLTMATASTGGRGGTRWVKTANLRGGPLRPTRLPKIFKPWREANGKHAGYLQGTLDSEGSFSGSRRGDLKVLNFTQKPGTVLTQTLAAFKELGLVTKTYAYHANHDDTKTVILQGGFTKVLECLGRVRPERLLSKLSEPGRKLPSFTLPDRGTKQWVKVKEVIPVGVQEVVRLSTTSQTLFGEGFPMHNTFGIPYGRSPAGLAPQLSVTKEAAEEYIHTFFKDFAPGLEKWLTYQRAKCIKEQVVISASGRRRRFPFIRDKYHRKEVERQGGNFVIQCTINEMTMVAQFKSVERLRAAGIPCKVWPHIHDSLNILVPIPLWKPAVEIIVKAMSEVPFETTVSFPAEIEVGERWGALKTVHARGKWVADDYRD